MQDLQPLTRPEGDMRWAAMLSIDMAGFTQITQDIGSERTYDLLRRVAVLATSIVESHGGYVVDTAGDGLLCAFGAPVAIENAALHACRAAFEIRQKILDDAASLEQSFGLSPAFRFGIAGGDVMVARQKDGAFKVVGDPVNLAARVQGSCARNEICLVDTLLPEVEGYLRCKAKGAVELKGFDAPVGISSIETVLKNTTRFEGIRRRGITALVSRRTEFEAAIATLGGETPQTTVSVIGVAGIGKSRLTHEVTTALSNRSTYVGQCAPKGQAPLAPIYSLVAQALGISSGQENVFSHLEDWCDPKKLKEVRNPETRAVVRAVHEREILLEALQKLSERKGALYVVEDAHWADQPTRGLLEGMSRIGLPLLVTSRPAPSLDYLSGPQTRTLNLEPLSSDDIKTFVDDLSRQLIGKDESDFIAEKSEGVPLIAEEMVRTLSSDPNSMRDLVTGNLAQLVLSRVDRLEPEAREALQLAATIGRDFSGSVLKHALGQGDAEFSFDDLVEARGADQWRFSHALIRDAVYNSMLTGQRKAAHAKIAAALLAEDSNPAELAEHYLLAEDDENAVSYLTAAARQNLKAYALSEVDANMTKAWSILDTTPDLVDGSTYADIATIWFRALDQTSRYGKICKLADPLCERLQAHGQTSAIHLVRNLQSLALTHLREYQMAERLALRTLELAEGAQDHKSAAWAKLALTRIYEETYWRRPSEIIELADSIAPVAEEFGDHHLGMMALYQKSSVYRSSGGHDEAIAVADEIAKYSDRHNDPRGRSYALWAKALVYVFEGNPKEAYDVIVSGKGDLLPEAADPIVADLIELFCLIFVDPSDDVVQRTLIHRKAAQELPDYNLIHSCDINLAIIALKTGRLAEGWAALSKLETQVREKGNVNITRQVLMLQAEALLGICRMIDPTSEFNDDTPEKTSKPKLADVLTFIRLRPFAKRLAERKMQEILDLVSDCTGTHTARALIGLGLIAASRKDTEKAKELLSKGKAVAVKEDINVLVKRAERTLVTLG